MSDREHAEYDLQLEALVEALKVFADSERPASIAETESGWAEGYDFAQARARAVLANADRQAAYRARKKVTAGG